MSENSLRPNKLRRHLETLHPSHIHVFFLVELYHLCKKVIIIELIFSLFLKKYRLMVAWMPDELSPAHNI